MIPKPLNDPSPQKQEAAKRIVNAGLNQVFPGLGSLREADAMTPGFKGFSKAALMLAAFWMIQKFRRP
jgi:hypothetical protein